VKVLVVLINYRTPDMTLESLDSALAALEGLPGSKVALVDNDSGDGSAALFAAALADRKLGERVELIETDHNGGFSYGVNAGARPALASSDPPDYIYLLNSDAKPALDAIHMLVEFLDERPEVGIAGSYVHGPAGDTHNTAFRFHSVLGEFEAMLGLGLVTRLLDRWVVSKDMPTEPTRMDWIAGASMMIRRTVFERLGGFDEDYFLYYEETDFCLQARRAGFPSWYVPASRVEHLGSVSTGWQDHSKPRAAFWFEGRRRYFLKNHRRAYLLAANLAWVVAMVLGQAKAALQRRHIDQPPHLLRDFVRYNFGRGRTGERAAS